MSIQSVGDLLRTHSFFRDMTSEDLQVISGCAKNVVLNSDTWIAHEGDAADQFFVLRSGRVAVETHLPERGSMVLETLGDGDVLGWSWLFPPYRWTFDVRVVEPVHALSLDGKCLRAKCEADPAMGYRLMKRFTEMMTSRLKASRLQMMDVYGSKGARLR